MLSKEDLGNGSKAGLINTDRSSALFSLYVRDIISHITSDRPKLRRICRNLNRRLRFRLICVCAHQHTHTHNCMNDDGSSVQAFAQRFIESFKVKDRKAITNGTNIMIVVSRINSGVTWKPAISPAVICAIAPGSKSADTNETQMPQSKIATALESLSSNLPRYSPHGLRSGLMATMG